MSNLKPDCNCEEHVGEVQQVRVFGHAWTRENAWEFNYCEGGIKTDTDNGFIVETVAEYEANTEADIAATRYDEPLVK